MDTRLKCLVCGGPTLLKDTICESCYSLFEHRRSIIDKGLIYIDEARSGYYYTGLLKEIIMSYKFGNKRYYSKLLGELLIDTVFDHLYHREVDIVVPVPLHYRSLKYRGFDHVELMLEDLEKVGLKISKNNLKKSKNTKEQAILSRSERKQNLIDSFKVINPKEYEGKNMLLIDDLITTGSTIEECGRVLKESGAKKVLAVSVASG